MMLTFWLPFRKRDNLGGRRAIRLSRNLKLDFDRPQDLASLAGDRIPLPGLHFTGLDGIQGVPKCVL
jgi:hypothetical protein